METENKTYITIDKDVLRSMLKTLNALEIQVIQLEKLLKEKVKGGLK